MKRLLFGKSGKKKSVNVGSYFTCSSLNMLLIMLIFDFNMFLITHFVLVLNNHSYRNDTYL